MVQQFNISSVELIKCIKILKKEILLGILLIGISTALMAASLICYPQVSYDQNTLYGTQDENLKDFLEEEGTITAKSGDPWIIVPLVRKIGVYSVILHISDMTGQNNAHISVSNNNGWFDQHRHLNNGKNEINFPIGIRNFAAVADLHQPDGAHHAVLLIQRLGEIIIMTLKFGILEPPDHAVDAEIRKDGFIRIEKNISRQPMVTFLQTLSFDPFTLDNFG